MTDAVQEPLSSCEDAGTREDAGARLLIDQASLRAAMRRLGIWQPVTVRWVSREDNPTAVSSVYYDGRRHMIELRHGMALEETAGALRRELAHCAQAEASGAEWAMAYAIDRDRWDAEIARVATMLEDVALIRDPNARPRQPATKSGGGAADPCAIQEPNEWVAIRADALAVIDTAAATIAEITRQFDPDEAERLCELVRSRVAHATREVLDVGQDLAA